MPTRIDSHQHFWRPSRCDYGWLTPDLAPLYRDFLPEDLLPLLEETSVSRTLLVQAAPTLAETHFMLGLADRYDFIAGVVGWVDMDNARQALSDLAAIAEHPKLVGIRPMIQDIEDVDWMLQRELNPTFEKLVELGLCFDALVLPKHLPNLRLLLERHPHLKAVIDHGAKPKINHNEMQPWADDIAAVAAQSSAYCKVSGLITEASETQSYEDVIPFCDHLMKCFGAERLMWGSDWPVLNLRGNYTDWHKGITKWLEPLSDVDRNAVLGDNAARFYALSSEA